ncbi:MAG: hypothetical protein ACPIOQ_06350 [Promethearchaeia archaeon]
MELFVAALFARGATRRGGLLLLPVLTDSACLVALFLVGSCSCPVLLVLLSCTVLHQRGAFRGSAMFELLRRQSLDLLGAYYADNVNDGMRGNTPSCDSMGPQNNRHVGDGSYCQPEDFLTPAERAATLGV